MFKKKKLIQTLKHSTPCPYDHLIGVNACNMKTPCSNYNVILLYMIAHISISLSLLAL